MKKIHNIRKDVLRIAMLLLVAAVLQISMLNWEFWKYRMDETAVYNKEYHLEDLEIANWSETSTHLVSLEDPILVLPGLACWVNDVRIQVDTEPEIPYLELFYINEELLQYGEVILRTDTPGQDVTVSLDDMVQDLRIDLGDDPGTALQSISITINPTEFRFSPQILVAIVIIYACGKFLLGLQQSPDYGLTDNKDNIIVGDSKE